MGGMSLARLVIHHLLCITVVSSDQTLTAGFLQCLNNATDTLIYRFTGFNCCVEVAGMTNHIAIRIVTDDHVELTGFNRSNQFISKFL